MLNQDTWRPWKASSYYRHSTIPAIEPVKISIGQHTNFSYFVTFKEETKVFSMKEIAFGFHNTIGWTLQQIGFSLYIPLTEDRDNIR